MEKIVQYMFHPNFFFHAKPVPALKKDRSLMILYA